MELPGIAYLLKNSQNLETLTLNAMGIQSFELDLKEHDFDERSYWKVESIPLHHLKAVRVNFYRTRYAEEILEGNEVQFLKFILKNLEVLERMIIKFTRRCKNIELEDDELPLFEHGQCLVSDMGMNATWLQSNEVARYVAVIVKIAVGCGPYPWTIFTPPQVDGLLTERVCLEDNEIFVRRGLLRRCLQLDLATSNSL